MTPLQALEILTRLIDNKTECYKRETIAAIQAIDLLQKVLGELEGKATLANAKRAEQEAKQAEFLKGGKAKVEAKHETDNPKNPRRKGRKRTTRS